MSCDDTKGEEALDPNDYRCFSGQVRGDQFDHLIHAVHTSGRTLRLQILPDRTILVTAPHHMDIEPFIRKKKAWIEKKLKELASLEEEYGDYDDMFLLNGSFYPITFASICSLPKTETGEVTYDTPENLKQMLIRLLILELEGKVSRFSALFGSHPRGITIRTQRTKWGSCSGTGMLNFNFALCALPREVRDYVVIHEVIHLEERNHSPAFWELVARFWPDYQDHERQLKVFWTLLQRNSIWKVLRSL